MSMLPPDSRWFTYAATGEQAGSDGGDAPAPLALGGVIIAIGLVLWVSAAPAHAQLIQPDESHYARAADGVALERARRNLLEAERRVARAAAQVARFTVHADAVIDARERFIDAHAAEVQRWAGAHRQSIHAGTGWHRVE